MSPVRKLICCSRGSAVILAAGNGKKGGKKNNLWRNRKGVFDSTLEDGGPTVLRRPSEKLGKEKPVGEVQKNKGSIRRREKSAGGGGPKGGTARGGRWDARQCARRGSTKGGKLGGKSKPQKKKGTKSKNPGPWKGQVKGGMKKFPRASGLKKETGRTSKKTRIGVENNAGKKTRAWCRISTNQNKTTSYYSKSRRGEGGRKPKL